ncbi:MAG: peptidase ClpP [Gemmatimonadales bacterium]|nr:MAG: peptidase ClpP [Gemmatimonadales bacterium]
MRLTGRRVVLGVSGGIASYKACFVARRLTEAGATVDVVLTSSAAEFVRPVTFEGLTGRPVLTSLWDRDRALAHISLARDSDLVIVAPATANLIARAAQGMADDLLTAILLARRGPVLFAPAMNDKMFSHPQTQKNLQALRARGWIAVGPETGPLAEGWSDEPGRMSEPEKIAAHAERLLRSPHSRLNGKKVVVTAGPTREPLDPVRVITNRSSGRMGYALARAAFARGAEVTLISGPTLLPSPPGIEPVRVESTEEMAKAVAAALKKAAVLVMAAAPADFRPARTAKVKRPRSEGPVSLELEPTPDILEKTKSLRRSCITVGFALETGPNLDRAKKKLEEKGLDLIVVNRADEPGSGAEVETNRVTVIGKKGRQTLPLLAKEEVAEKIWDAVEELL